MKGKVSWFFCLHSSSVFLTFTLLPAEGREKKIWKLAQILILNLKNGIAGNRVPENKSPINCLSSSDIAL